MFLRYKGNPVEEWKGIGEKPDQDHFSIDDVYVNSFIVNKRDNTGGVFYRISTAKSGMFSNLFDRSKIYKLPRHAIEHARKVINKELGIALFTREGKPASVHDYVPVITSQSVPATFPIKGSIKVSKGKTEYNVWTLDGMSAAPWSTPCKPPRNCKMEKRNGTWYVTSKFDLMI